MKNPKLMFLTNIAIALYLGGLVYYLFWHFFQYEITNFDEYAEEEKIAANTGVTMEKSLLKDSIEYYKKASKDSEEFTNLKLYMFTQNIIKCLSFRISIGKPRGLLKSFNRFLQSLILLLAIFGLFNYVIPIYYVNSAYPK